MAIYEIGETNTPEVGRSRRSLQVALEFHVNIAPGQETSSQLNAALTDVERAMLSDRQNGGLALDTRSLRNEFDLGGGPEAKTAGGVALFEILYRHLPNDPTVQV